MTAYARENVEKEQNSSIADMSANIYNLLGNQYGSFSENWESVLRPSYTTWEHIPKEYTVIPQGTSSAVFKAIVFVILFVVSRTWKPSRCPSTEKWIKKL